MKMYFIIGLIYAIAMTIDTALAGWHARKHYYEMSDECYNLCTNIVQFRTVPWWRRLMCFVLWMVVWPFWIVYNVILWTMIILYLVTGRNDNGKVAAALRWYLHF